MWKTITAQWVTSYLCPSVALAVFVCLLRIEVKKNKANRCLCKQNVLVEVCSTLSHIISTVFSNSVRNDCLLLYIYRLLFNLLPLYMPRSSFVQFREVMGFGMLSEWRKVLQELHLLLLVCLSTIAIRYAKVENQLFMGSRTFIFNRAFMTCQFLQRKKQFSKFLQLVKEFLSASLKRIVIIEKHLYKQLTMEP